MLEVIRDTSACLSLPLRETAKHLVHNYLTKMLLHMVVKLAKGKLKAKTEQFYGPIVQCYNVSFKLCNI